MLHDLYSLSCTSMVAQFSGGCFAHVSCRVCCVSRKILCTIFLIKK
ncbi:rCG51174 [Rattus norvegicus]|uniref:RCG51174 n=1 Tax=Rattus norvegicus TaxID=10116 RepID=A6IYK0_RAT|nr:rCG51174 [Rattus norvegicus]